MKNFTFSGTATTSSFSQWLAKGMKREFINHGFEFLDEAVDDIRLVFNFVDKEHCRPFRRKAQATFVVSILESSGEVSNIFKEAYPYLIRSLSNHLMYVNHSKHHSDIYFLTPEQGCYKITYKYGQNENEFFAHVYERLEPLALSRLVIENDFHYDLPKNLWTGDQISEKLSVSGKKLDDLNLLPAPFPINEYLNKRDMRHLNKLYGIGGLSYGNLSARQENDNFWMSASGIDKSNMKTIGQDILYIKGYNSENNHIEVSVPPEVTPKRASVDAIEHWMIYKEHPEVGSIVHIHAWMDDVQATEINYPCGTLELAKTVAQLVREAENPARTVIGLKNHGLTITGPDLDDIFERIDGKITRQVPMS
ncbi:class II aldolase/adducin family protein [Desertibacillus haloalkaliphilus]|uniref:class II aldolase/adducin family protein n=1 Tax=Desertibacillus haloalkaliphilus TaxID=1328930 RepID=UPI001C25679B|nr:class II aldolase/adducin family protein [Desertibacillus haloalkaliphilus]MBU8906933.1 class II aldolase/adducin family protein [Desertibacillus haloalkaliphilus]